MRSLTQGYLAALPSILRDERATAAGFSNFPTQVFSSIGPTIAGSIMQSFSLDPPLELAALFQAANATLYYTFFHEIKPPEERGASETTVARPVSPLSLWERECVARRP